MDTAALLSSLSKVYGEPVRIYGPYMCGDGRLRADIRLEGGSKTHQYARLLLEAKLQRRLVGKETVDHIDGDYTNDSLDNLRVLSNADNARMRGVVASFVCPYCETVIELRGDRLRNAKVNRAKGRAGPFCNRSCAGKYSTQVQWHGRVPELV